ncbi:MFS transporter [Thermoplasma sp. Kam2015]|uniref:MFS transporter n=1 Tax=Thermoplasma sp. Kam2015 TaxID=2094122 RepID=UPI000D8430FE|nr:MFS transporter [Thermoplasma sp. Kam2015]PYB68087.1 MFS transporter [Thermoplasma sp. Kam2015]
MEASVNFTQSAKIRSLVFTSLGHFTNDFNILLFSILITYYHSDFGISLAVLGAVAIIYSIISGLLSTPIGRYADKTRRYRFLLLSGFLILGISVYLFALSFVSASLALPVMIVASILFGFGQAFYHPLGSSVLNLTYGNSSASALGINGAFGSIGRSALPVILVPLIILVGEKYALIVLGSYMIIAGVIIYSGLSFIREHEIPASSRSASSSRNRDTLSRYSSVLAIIVAMVFIRSMFLTGTTTYISQFVLDRVRSETMMSIILTISFLTAVAGQPYFGRLTQKHGGKFTIGLTTGLSTLFFIFFMFAGTDPVLNTITYALYVFTAFSGFPVLMGYVNQIVPREISTTAGGMVWGIGNTVGGGIGIAIISILLYVHTTLIDAMWIMTIFGAVSLILFPLIPNKRSAARMKASTS